MDTTTINRILRSLPSTQRQYAGCFPSDALNLPSRYPSAAVINTDESDQPGTHWVAVYMKSPSTVYYFDSYGIDPVANVEAFLSRFAHRTENSCIIQSVNSYVCGHYCIFFLIHCCRGFSYEQIMSILLNQNNPDAFVANFVRRLMK